MFNCIHWQDKMLLFPNMCFQYFILFHVITASYLLGREQKYTAGSVSSEGDSVFYSGISAVKSGTHEPCTEIVR